MAVTPHPATYEVATYEVAGERGGFTLIELVIALAIATLISAVLYLSLQSALDSWRIAQEQLTLQQVSAKLMEELSEGLPETFGMRDALEIADAAPYSLSCVMPWTDATHDVYSGVKTYTLNKHLKPGTSLPLAEARLPEEKEFRVVPAALLEKGKSEDYPQAQLKMEVPAGSQLRFTFHPDCKRDADTLTVFRYDPEAQAVFIEDKDGARELSKNLFGVKIADFRLRYFDSANNELGFNGAVDTRDIPAVTGVETYFKAKNREGSERETLTFTCLRNAPMKSGNITLREGMKFPIPNSREIKALFLTNLSGVEHNDRLILEAKPQSGKIWRVTVTFFKYAGLNSPIIGSCVIEYPPGSNVYAERPRTPVELGLNLLNLGPNGLFDYDLDQPGDFVLLEGKVEMTVKRMDIGGAALFVRP